MKTEDYNDLLKIIKQCQQENESKVCECYLDVPARLRSVEELYDHNESGLAVEFLQDLIVDDCLDISLKNFIRLMQIATLVGSRTSKWSDFLPPGVPL